MPKLPPKMTIDQSLRLHRLATDPVTKPYMEAGSAQAIPEAERGLWYIHKVRCRWPIYFPVGTYTCLARWTDSTIHLNAGESVMVDNPAELSLHLNAAMYARGTVLVTGLGLACVARMLQANPLVESITVVEKEQDVIDLVWPYTSHDRIELVHADAFEYLKKCRRRWDCTWHDIWSDTDRDEPHLQVQHMKLMKLCSGKVQRNLGAWKFPRHHMRAVQRLGV
jgi:hypothetical protein